MTSDSLVGWYYEGLKSWPICRMFILFNSMCHRFRGPGIYIFRLGLNACNIHLVKVRTIFIRLFCFACEKSKMCFQL